MQNQDIEKIQAEAEKHYGMFLTSLGYDWENDTNMKDTPKRVAKMYVKETTKSTYEDRPKITSFDNVKGYTGLVFQGNIEVKSLCSHHMCPFIGKAHVAYIPSEKGKIIGLSKFNRIVDYYSRKPQVQENLTMEIHKALTELCEDNLGVAVYIEAGHTCVSLRGIQQDSIMKTTELSGAFKSDASARNEFMQYIATL